MNVNQIMRDWHVVITGSGSYLPERRVSNDELIASFNLDTTDEWIRENTGIEFRHFAADCQGASDLGAEAAKMALRDANINARELDRIIFCSSTADWSSPAAASNIQQLLGADCPAEDKQTACASFLFGVDHAARLIATGCRNILVVAGEVKSRFIRGGDRRLAPVFADGAAAWIMSRELRAEGIEVLENTGIVDCLLWTDGSCLQNIITPAGGSAMPATAETVAADLHTVRMNVPGRQIAADAVKTMTRLSREICARNGISPADSDLFIPHQANLRIMNETAGELGLREEKVVNVIRHTANIVSATIPYAYDQAYRSGRFAPGMLILMTTVGAGYAGGSILYRVPGRRSD